MTKKNKTETNKNSATKKKPLSKQKPVEKENPEKKDVLVLPAKAKNENSFPIVGLGASAGGLEALEIFFNHMPSDSNMSFVIIQHLSPKHKSIMASLLAKCTQMQVFEMKDGIEIKPNCVYLNPPDKNVVIINGTLQLMERVKTEGINLPIDSFFRSMASDLGEKAICIILSGTATDGTLGLKAVKGEGGIAIVQDPDSAKYDGMPRSAIATGIVDYILPVEKIPGKLVKYINTPYIGVPKIIKTVDDHFSNYIQKVFVLIRTSTGHDLSHYKQTTICRRIERRMAIHQINKISIYVKYLQETPSEIKILFKDMLIGVTNFFRDPEAFELLEEKVIYDLLKRKKSESSIRIWVVGCSTGEEAYSIAIILSELIEKLNISLNVQIFASDIDAQAIEHARVGIYPDSIAADISKKRLNHFFLKEKNTYKVKKQIREMVVFAVQNVINDPPFSKLDMISCRNLLIYMDSELQKKILPLFHYSLNIGGVLFLGTSESIGEFTNLFKPVNSKLKIYNYVETFLDKTAEHSQMPFSITPQLYDSIDKKNFPVNSDIHTMAEKIILENYSLPGVLINEKFEIIHFMGKVDKYLKTPTGKASFAILKMAREGLQFKLSSALHNAVRQLKTTEYKALPIKYNGSLLVVDVIVRPLIERKDSQGFILVMFDDKTISEMSASSKKKKTKKVESEPDVVRLEHELEATKEHLQTTIEELETSNEELKSTNEEMQSVNEELQSTNEELETSKEELQSTNEELVTVNTELQNKIDELSQTNNDINNLLASTDIGTIFLDTNLLIRRFTPAMTRIFNLIQTDINRPISDITSKVIYKKIHHDAKQVLDTLIRKEEEVQDKNGNWFYMRMSPYRTLENVIDGIVITFVDITQKIQMEEALQTSEERFRSLFEQASESIVLVDSKTGKFLEFNQMACDSLGYTRKEFEKLNIYDLESDSSAREINDHINKVTKEGFNVFETQLKTKQGEMLTTKVSSKSVSIHGKHLIQSIWWKY